MKIKCPICGKNAAVDCCDEVIGEFFLDNHIRMEIECDSCQSEIVIYTYNRKKFDEFLQKLKV